MCKLNRYIFLILLATIINGAVSGCNASPSATVADEATVQKKDSATQANNKPAASSLPSNDEQQFRIFLKEFKAAAQQKNKKRLAGMLYFPLQTTPQWSNDDLKATTVNPDEGLVTASEYPQYEGAIFTADALRLIPKSAEDDLSEIDSTTNENYYKVVAKITDKGSKLYELQQQFTQSNNKETSYGFVFGKVNGQYKIISYYSPWPIKG